MQTTKLHLRGSQFIYWIFSVAIVICFSSCAKKMSFGISQAVPSAEGSVKIKTDKNKNYAISVNVVNLAPPERLTPPMKEYIVWMEADGTRAKNLGRLRTSNGLFSSKFKASLKTVTTFKPVNFYITAENDANTSWPSAAVILKTN